MHSRIKPIALSVSAIIIFIAGVMWGVHMARPDEKASIAGSSDRGNAASDTAPSGIFDERPNKRRTQETHQPVKADAAQQQILRNLREAMLLPKETRIRPLLRALEETTKLPLRKDLLDAMRSIIDEGEIESSHYLLSLMEQREEKASVDMLLHAAKHQNPDISDRALFALEAVAGTVFKNLEEAETWAATWKPDPERAKLFADEPQTEEESPEAVAPRAPGTRRVAPMKIDSGEVQSLRHLC
ncbi:MAG: hypothetical protein ACK5VX_11990 [Akkermansiaceae bacterium]